MNRDVPTDLPIVQVAKRRWSPRAFDETPVTREELEVCFEAARWAPSAYNEQPWRFSAATRDDPGAFAAMLSCLSEWNRSWAHRAGALIMIAAKRAYSHNGKANAHARYDAGQAAAWMTVQAVELGLQAHQMAGFSEEKAREVLGVPDDFEPVAFIAVGRVGDPSILPEAMAKLETAPRTRRPIAETVYGTRWGVPYSTTSDQ